MAGVGVVLVIVLVAAGIGAAMYYSYKKRQARIAAVAALGKQLGLEFSPDDTHRIASMPFALFERGDGGRKADLVLSGTYKDLPVQLFDYEYYDETENTVTNADGSTHTETDRDYHRFTCGTLQLPAACPHLRVGHEGFFSRLGSHLGLKDVEFEYDDFNRKFRVKCDDQKFAFSLFDGAMMEWLLGVDGFATFEVNGPYVLVAANQLDPQEWTYLITWLEQFKAHVPSVVLSTYPARTTSG